MSEKDDALAAMAPREEAITVGKLACTMHELESAADMLVFIDREDSSYKLIVRCLFGPDGVPLFSDDDIPALKTRSFKKLQPLIECAQRVNGMNAEDELKNSQPQPSDSPTT